MAYFRKGVGLVRVPYKTNLQARSAKLDFVAGKYLIQPAASGVDVITSVTVNDKSIGKALITNPASLTEVHLPAEYTAIGPKAFDGCSNLESIYIYAGSVIPISEDAIPSGCAIYVDYEFVAEYQAEHPTLTFVGFNSGYTWEVPYIEGVTPTTLTAQYIEDCVVQLGGMKNTIGVAIIPDYFTNYGSGSIQTLANSLPNLQDVKFGDGPQTFSNLAWHQIQAIAQLGKASSKFSLGDTKVDTDVNLVAHTYRIVDFDHYGTNEINVENMNPLRGPSLFNSSSNKDDDGAINNYSISNMRTSVLPAVLASMPQSLQSVIGETTYKVLKNGSSSQILTLTDKLFLPATIEYKGTISGEGTTFALYAANDNNDFRIKYDSSNTAVRYRARNPLTYLASKNANMGIYSNGGIDNMPSDASLCFSPVFSIK